ncbi:hypothetical protein [Fulvimarina sp. MAC3]|uniref:hypothetical protein n=1 Tax=Fulvimarina sp. MAC3 TaxID=3148887 RepID=UPI0031FBFA3B
MSEEPMSPIKGGFMAGFGGYGPQNVSMNKETNTLSGDTQNDPAGNLSFDTDGEPDTSKQGSQNSGGEELNTFPYRLVDLDLRLGETLLEYALSTARNSYFTSLLMRAAAYASGVGLDANPVPVVALALRTNDPKSSVPPAPLAALARLLAEDPGKGRAGEKSGPPIQICEFDGKIAASQTPESLAGFLSQEIAVGNVVADKLIVWVRDASHSRGWETVSLCGHDALSKILRDQNKQLILGIELSGRRRISDLVHSDNRIFPLPWALPLVLDWAEKRDIDPDRIETEALLDFEANIRWLGRKNDGNEWNAFVRVAAGLAEARTPDGLTSRLRSNATRSFDVEDIWERPGRRVDAAFGLAELASAENRDQGERSGEKPPPDPRVLHAALVFTAAFCSALPGPAFRSFARACLDPKERVSFADLTEADLKHIQELKTVSGKQADIAKERPRIIDYFDRWADQILRYYDIRAEPDGHYRLGKDWDFFPVADHIGSSAPIQAGELVARLLSNIEASVVSEQIDHRVVLEILAGIRCHLPTALADDQLVAWLGEFAFYDFLKKNLTFEGRKKFAQEETFARDHRQKAIRNATFLARELTGDLRADGDLVPSERAALCLAKTMTIFLSACRSSATQRDGHDRPEAKALADGMIEAALNAEDWPAPFEVAFALWMMLLGPADRLTGGTSNLRRRIAFFQRNRRNLVFLRTIVHSFLHTGFDSVLAPSAPLERFARIVEILKAGSAEAPDPWQAIGDVVTEHIVNLEIRWLTPQTGLVEYRKMRHPRFASLIVQEPFQKDSPEALVRDHVVERFFAVSPADWLARSAGGMALGTVRERLKDILSVLLDGVPDGLGPWQDLSVDEKEKRVLRSLLAHCNAPADLTVGTFFERLDALGTDFSSPDAKALVGVYGLFWPALLLHWRCQTLGVAPIGGDQAGANGFRAFLLDLRDRLSDKRLAELRHGLCRLALATEEALFRGAESYGDPSAAKFYLAKAEAARMLALALQTPERAHPQDNQGDTPCPAIPSDMPARTAK